MRYRAICEYSRPVRKNKKRGFRQSLRPGTPQSAGRWMTGRCDGRHRSITSCVKHRRSATTHFASPAGNNRGRLAAISFHLAWVPSEKTTGWFLVTLLSQIHCKHIAGNNGAFCGYSYDIHRRLPPERASWLLPRRSACRLLRGAAVTARFASMPSSPCAPDGNDGRGLS